MTQKFGHESKKFYLKAYCNLIDIKMFTFTQIFKKCMVSMVFWHYRINRISIKKPVPRPKVPFLLTFYVPNLGSRTQNMTSLAF